MTHCVSANHMFTSFPCSIDQFGFHYATDLVERKSSTNWLLHKRRSWDETWWLASNFEVSICNPCCRHSCYKKKSFKKQDNYYNKLL